MTVVGVAYRVARLGTVTTKALAMAEHGRTWRDPKVDDAFLWRICHAIDLPPRMLARAIGVPYVEIEELLGEARLLSEIDRNDTWWKIQELVDRRLGSLMAIRYELQRQLEKDRARRVVRVNTALERTARFRGR